MSIDSLKYIYNKKKKNSCQPYISSYYITSELYMSHSNTNTRNNNPFQNNNNNDNNDNNNDNNCNNNSNNQNNNKNYNNSNDSEDIN